MSTTVESITRDATDRVFGEGTADLVFGEGTKTIDMFALTEDDIEIHYRQKLGEGGFCSAYPVQIRSWNAGQLNEDLAPFVLKRFNLHIAADPRALAGAYADLVQEAKVLKALQHDNIIQLLGMSEEAIAKEKFFIILEKLESTLDLKLADWAKIRGPLRQITPKQSVVIRIKEIALDIAHGMDYLHSQQYIYRDLKPANIGFITHSGQVKIFDFGLAIHVPKGMTVKGKAGTVRYMAPEMKNDKVYNCSVDVFSYAILLWQIITSRIPFERELPPTSFSPSKKLPDNKRPNLKYVESRELAELLERCWKTLPNDRWTFRQILPELRKIATATDTVRNAEKIPPPSRRRLFLSSVNNY